MGVGERSGERQLRQERGEERNAEVSVHQMQHVKPGLGVDTCTHVIIDSILKGTVYGPLEF